MKRKIDNQIINKKHKQTSVREDLNIDNEIKVKINNNLYICKSIENTNDNNFLDLLRETILNEIFKVTLIFETDNISLLLQFNNKNIKITKFNNYVIIIPISNSHDNMYFYTYYYNIDFYYKLQEICNTNSNNNYKIIYVYLFQDLIATLNS